MRLDAVVICKPRRPLNIKRTKHKINNGRHGHLDNDFIDNKKIKLVDEPKLNEELLPDVPIDPAVESTASSAKDEVESGNTPPSNYNLSMIELYKKCNCQCVCGFYLCDESNRVGTTKVNLIISLSSSLY